MLLERVVKKENNRHCIKNRKKWKEKPSQNVFLPFIYSIKNCKKAKNIPPQIAGVFQNFLDGMIQASNFLMQAMPMGVGPVCTPMVQPI